jgi:hypothetical protein
MPISYQELGNDPQVAMQFQLALNQQRFEQQQALQNQQFAQQAAMQNGYMSPNGYGYGNHGQGSAQGYTINPPQTRYAGDPSSLWAAMASVMNNQATNQANYETAWGNANTQRALQNEQLRFQEGQTVYRTGYEDQWDQRRNDTQRYGYDQQLMGQLGVAGLDSQTRLGTAQLGLQGQLGAAQMGMQGQLGSAQIGADANRYAQDMQAQTALAQFANQYGIANLQNQGDTQRAQISANASTVPAYLRQDRFNQILPLFSGILGGLGFGGGGSSTPPPTSAPPPSQPDPILIQQPQPPPQFMPNDTSGGVDQMRIDRIMANVAARNQGNQNMAAGGGSPNTAMAYLNGPSSSGVQQAYGSMQGAAPGMNRNQLIDPVRPQQTAYGGNAYGSGSTGPVAGGLPGGTGGPGMPGGGATTGVWNGPIQGMQGGSPSMQTQGAYGSGRSMTPGEVPINQMPTARPQMPSYMSGGVTQPQSTQYEMPGSGASTGVWNGPVPGASGGATQAGSSLNPMLIDPVNGSGSGSQQPTDNFAAGQAALASAAAGVDPRIAARERAAARQAQQAEQMIQYQQQQATQAAQQQAAQAAQPQSGGMGGAGGLPSLGGGQNPFLSLIQGMPTGPLVNAQQQQQMLNSALAGNAASASQQRNAAQGNMASRGWAPSSPALGRQNNLIDFQQMNANTQARTQIPLQIAQANGQYGIQSAQAAQQAQNQYLGALSGYYGAQSGFLSPILGALASFGS